MVIQFPRRLVTEQDRKEAKLIAALEMSAAYFEELGIDIDPWLEELAELFDEILEDDSL
jgi:hypothetical protein